jgi:hypothetical protein
VLYHAPSLVQHVGTQSVHGGSFHQAFDFDLTWRAGQRMASNISLKKPRIPRAAFCSFLPAAKRG